MKWIGVKDRLPEINLKEYTREFSRDVLVKDHKNDCQVAFKERANNKEYWQFKIENESCCMCICPNFYDINNLSYREITYWMELPPPPKKEEKDQIQTDKWNNENIKKEEKQKDADRKSTRLNSSHTDISRMPSSA